MALLISDITQYTGSEYGVYRFQAKATDNKGVYADSSLSNIETYNIPLLNISISEKTITITGFITNVNSVKLYMDNEVAATLARTTESQLTYTISDEVDPKKPHKIYVVAEGDGIRENYSNTVIYGVLPTFADNDWDTIAGVSEQIARLSLEGDLLYTYIKQQFGWEVGMTKSFTTKDGSIYNAQIWDFNDKVDKNGNKLGITFGCVELLKTTYPMNATNTNAGGFGASEMANTTLPSVLETLPEDLINVIKDTKITYHSGSDDPTTELSGNFKLYLPSEYEIFHSTNHAVQEGVWLKYWQLHNTAADRVKKRYGGASGTYWWLRSAVRSSIYLFAGVSSSGSMDYYNAGDMVSVCLCFNV